MWSEYTRERPARRGLAVGSAFILLVGVTVLAWAITAAGPHGTRSPRGDERSSRPVLTPLPREQSPPGWPIAFTLPEEYAWVEEPEAGREAEQGRRDDGSTEAYPESDPLLRVPTDFDGNIGAAAFIGENERGTAAGLRISFAVLSNDALPAEVRALFTEDDLPDSRRIRLGPIKGRMTESVKRSPTRVQLVQYVAVGSLPSGPALRVEYATVGPKAESARIFEEFCASITFKDWWIAP